MSDLPLLTNEMIYRATLIVIEQEAREAKDEDRANADSTLRLIQSYAQKALEWAAAIDIPVTPDTHDDLQGSSTEEVRDSRRREVPDR